MALIGFNPFITAFIALIHPFFVSVIEINHNEKEATIEISVRTFTNDIEKMMGADAKTTIDLSQANQKNKANQTNRATSTIGKRAFWNPSLAMAESPPDTVTLSRLFEANRFNLGT